jgi:hypothetical protein
MEKKKGKISVTVQTEERMAAITYLAEAIRDTAKALAITPRIHVENCHINNAGLGISIDTAEDVTETDIVEVDE